jgi:hypothetical protein
VTLASTTVSSTAVGSPTPGRRRRRVVSVSVALASGVGMIVGLPLEAHATEPAVTTFSFSGAVSGTLTMANRTCTGSGGQYEFDGKMLKGSRASMWTVNVNTPSAKGGTWKKFPHNVVGVTNVSVVLQAHTSSKDYDWITKSGEITTSRTGGNVNVILGPDHSLSGVPGNGMVHLIGSWGCT